LLSSRSIHVYDVLVEKERIENASKSRPKAFRHRQNFLSQQVCVLGKFLKSYRWVAGNDFHKYGCNVLRAEHRSALWVREVQTDGRHDNVRTLIKLYEVLK
jgi:hypothetical protein